MQTPGIHPRWLGLLFLAQWVRPAPAHADGTSLGLGHAEVWIGIDQINEAKSNQGVSASTKQFFWGGLDVTYSGLGALWKQQGPLRFGDLFAVNVGGGLSHVSGNSVAAGIFDARAGAQLLYAVSLDVDIGLEGGACSCAQFDQFAGGDVREILPFGGARVRWQRLSIGLGWLRGPHASAAWDIGIGRAGIHVVLPSQQTRYPQDGSNDFFNVTGVLTRLSLGRDF